MSKVKKIVKKVAPIALPVLGAASGNPFLAAAGGAAGGAASGGGLKAALLGAGTAYAGSALNSGGLSSSLFGTAASKPLAAGVLGPSSLGTPGLLGTFGKIGNAAVSQYAKPAATIFSGLRTASAQDDVEEKLLKAQGRSEQALNPYAATGSQANTQLGNRLAEGYKPEDFENDPGYQFERDQGLKSLDRMNASRGGYFSGAALKEAGDFTSSLASRRYNEGYQRWLQQNNQLSGQAGQGLNATYDLTNVFDNQGLIGANKTVGRNNLINSTLSNLMQGTRRVVGHNANGEPVYEDEEYA